MLGLARGWDSMLAVHTGLDEGPRAACEAVMHVCSSAHLQLTDQSKHFSSSTCHATNAVLLHDHQPAD